MNLRAVAVAALVLASACAGGRGLIPAESGASVAVSAESALLFQRRIDAFYRRLTQRRFNALGTFNDPVLRDYFRSLDLFFDYYADLAHTLAEAHFEKSRPNRVEIQEFVFEHVEAAQVRVRFRGDDRRPLRPGAVSVVRRDRWERIEGSWWIAPGKL